MTTLKSGMIFLAPLHELAHGDKCADAIHRNCTKGRIFGRMVRELCREISESQGFYAWGRFDKRNVWKNIYVGMSGTDATLRERIKWELNNERVLFWARVHRDPVCRGMEFYGPGGIAVRNEVSPAREKFLRSHFQRALRKKGATHIVWVGAPSVANENLRAVESELIKTLAPKANRQRAKQGLDIQKWRNEVICSLETQIAEVTPTV